MKTRMFSMLMVLSSLMVMLSIVDCYAVLTPPTITASVEIEGDRKHYQYTLTNTALDHDGAPVVIGGFILWLTEAGWLAIESHDSPAGWKYNLRIGTGFATASWFTDNLLQPGDSAVFSIYTPASVPTGYSAPPDDPSTNWYWAFRGGAFGDTLLPVPVPEPSSILALASGLVGVGGVVFRRRSM